MSLGGRRPVPGALGKPKKPRGQASEHENAKILGARLQSGSGNYAGAKGDMTLVTPGSFLLENKATVHASFNLPYSFLRKITKEARHAGKRPGLIVDFENVEGSTPTKWAMIPLELFKKLLDELGHDYERLDTE